MPTLSTFSRLFNAFNPDNHRQWETLLSFLNNNMLGNILTLFLTKDQTGESQAEADINLKEDFSGTAQDFILKPPAGELFLPTRMIVDMRTSGALDSGYYGNSTVVLANGLNLLGSFGGVEGNSTPVAVKTNGGYAKYMYDLQAIDFGRGDQYMSGRLTFAKFGRVAYDGDYGDKLILRANDNFSTLGLVEHTFCVQGMRVTKEQLRTFKEQAYNPEYTEA